MKSFRLILLFLLLFSFFTGAASAQRKRPAAAPRDPQFAKYAIYQKTAPRAGAGAPQVTTLPVKLNQGDRIALIGNTLLERSHLFGQLETLLQQAYPQHRLTVRNLAWPGDTAALQPRPANFADIEQHLTHEKIDVIFAAFGFNESFQSEAGLPDFKQQLSAYIAGLKTKAFNGKTGPRIVLISPIANENIEGVAAADRNNANIKKYADAMKQVAAQQQIGYVNAFDPTEAAMRSPGTDLTINGSHLTKEGYDLFAKEVFKTLTGKPAPAINEKIREVVVDKNRQFMRRYRPLNTFYYTGGRNKAYGYLDFLPAMRNFELLVANREQRIWDMAAGKQVPAKVDDSNIPVMPPSQQSRGANEWMSAADELKAFKIDPRFEVNLFAGEEQFPDIAAPIQMRWDNQGRMWVSCSTTYPHVYPGSEPADKLVILEDTDGDGKADKSTVFADDLHIPLSFEFGDGGVYVSEMPGLSFLKDTDGDGKADTRRVLLTGFGVEDSHHALHDFAWTPDGDLVFRESVFHHSQVETPYGPVRQQNSGWFRYHPASHRLTSFGTYSSTNPWGVTFDDWGQHMASHPVYAAAFHSLDPEYPTQHPRPAGLRAYSGVCGHEFVDFKTFPKEMQGDFIKVRYKPTNRVEIHHWKETEFGYDEEYVGDLIFSTNLSFIPVDLRYGPRGAMYVCDWYNPVKGHAQYSLRDPRRDRHSGRIWRITAKGHKLQDPPKIAGASIGELLNLLKAPQYRYRYWAKRELRERNKADVKAALDKWLASLDKTDDRYRHHQIEGVWLHRWIGEVNAPLLRELIKCENHHARAAAVQQLRYWHPHMEDTPALIRAAANDENAIVRMEAAIAASYVGTRAALDAMLDVFKHPRGGHLQYAITCALGSHTLKPLWENNPEYNLARIIKQSNRMDALREPTPNGPQSQFDSQKNLKTVKISCVPERMLFSQKKFAVTPGQAVKIVFSNPDATDHNLVIVQPGALAEVGIAANEMAKDPRNASSDFIPREKKNLIVQSTPMIGPTRSKMVHVMRFKAPQKPGVYPYVCTFPGHWVVMNGVMIVTDDLENADALLARSQPQMVKEWKTADFPAALTVDASEEAVVRGMQAFVKARCNQCHVAGGHGVNLGPDLVESVKKLQGAKLLAQILEPSATIHKDYLPQQFFMEDGQVIAGVVVKEDRRNYHVVSNLLTPNAVTQVKKKDVEEKIVSKLSPMPAGLVNVLTKQEILDLLSFVQHSEKLPEHLRHKER